MERFPQRNVNRLPTRKLPRSLTNRLLSTTTFQEETETCLRDLAFVLAMTNKVKHMMNQDTFEAEGSAV